MTKLVADQADGLRRLLAHTPTRVVAVAGMGRGGSATEAAMNLGAALVQQGKDVLVLDEHGADGGGDLRRLGHRSARRPGRRGRPAADAAKARSPGPAAVSACCRRRSATGMPRSIRARCAAAAWC